MNLFPLSNLIYTLLAFGAHQEGATSDTKGDIIGRYIGMQVEEETGAQEEEEEQEESDDND